jgi:prepilin-type N-terminal cleavage/methylation domain-containing protein/prepilin-type processing-associated H-X9-DG protein
MTQKMIKRYGFTLTELVVVTAVGGMMFTLSAPAVQKGKEDLNRRRCENNLRQLGVAMHTFANVNGGLPPMAARTSGSGWPDDHGWYSFVGPFIGSDAWASTIDFSVSMSHASNFQARRGGMRLRIHACPADIGLQRNEWSSVNWAQVRSNYVVNAGNTNYGQTAQFSVPFLGAPFGRAIVTPLTAISDGVENTLMMSEVVVFPSTVGWGGVYSATQVSLGGQMFTGWSAPNSSFPDGIGYGRNGNVGMSVANALYGQQGIPLPLQQDNTPLTTYIAPRSKHAGGVNASMCDGSVRFVENGINVIVWRAMSTSQGAEVAPATAPAEKPRRMK